MSIKYWNRRKEKKARFKRKIARLRKRGVIVYGGYILMQDDIIGF